MRQNNQKNTFKEWFNTIFYGGLIAITFRSLLFEPFNIPSGSMIPTLQVGDHVFVTKWNFGYSRYSFPFGSWKLWNGRINWKEPNVGDVVVFRYPKNESLDFVKRLIAKEGDTVQIINGRLFINGQQIERKNEKKFIVANLPKSLKHQGFSQNNIFVNGNNIYENNKPVEYNYTIEYKDESYCDYNNDCGIFEYKEYTEVLPNGKEHPIIEFSDNEYYDNTELITIPKNYYFVMGDNRDNSSDSRAFGLVPKDYLMGKVWFVWYSHNYYSILPFIWNWGKKLRFERFGQVIN